MGHDLGVAQATLDGRDVGAWAGRTWTGAVDGDWVELGERYVQAHPRTPGGVAEAQRLALLRRLAAGPAARAELLAAMRTAGYVGATDFENRMRDLRAGDSRAAGRAGLAVQTDGIRWWLPEPFALLGDADRRALGFARAMVARLDGPLATQAELALDRMLPGVGTMGAHIAPQYPASPADFERFHLAMEAHTPVRVRYFSLNSGRERTYNLVPLEYVAVGTTVKAVCIEVNQTGRPVMERQFAMDRVRAVEALEGWPRPADSDLAPRRSELVLEVTEELYQVMRDRNLFGTAAATAEEMEAGVWRVTGSFPVALAWDVMEQLCAWAGNAQVRRPYWLVNAVVRRLSAGLRVMVEGAAFELVKPEVERSFADHRDAVASEQPLPAATGPRKLPPPD
jgi:predicted DNA-binding transcriptional regulator YafY